jgi:hypothetical protein
VQRRVDTNALGFEVITEVGSRVGAKPLRQTNIQMPFAISGFGPAEDSDAKAKQTQIRASTFKAGG